MNPVDNSAMKPFCHAFEFLDADKLSQALKEYEAIQFILPSGPPMINMIYIYTQWLWLLYLRIVHTIGCLLLDICIKPFLHRIRKYSSPTRIITIGQSLPNYIQFPCNNNHETIGQSLPHSIYFFCNNNKGTIGQSLSPVHSTFL